MTIDKKFIDLFINVSAKAALASHYLVGKKDKISADKAAVDSMRIELNKLDMNIPMAQKIYSKLRIVRNNKIARMSLQQAKLNHIENYYLASLRNIIMKKTNVISSRTNYIWEYDAHVQVERELKNYSFNKTTNI